MLNRIKDEYPTKEEATAILLGVRERNLEVLNIKLNV